MSSRFGRNQKRKMREQLSKQESMYTCLQRDIERMGHKQESTIARAERILSMAYRYNPNSLAFPPATVNDENFWHHHVNRHHMAELPRRLGEGHGKPPKTYSMDLLDMAALDYEWKEDGFCGREVHYMITYRDKHTKQLVQSYRVSPEAMSNGDAELMAEYLTKTLKKSINSI